MAPLKFEDNIKEKLEQRTIKPSNKAWNKLEQQLESESGQEENRKNWWWSIAASFIGFLIIATMFFTINKKTTKVDVKLVDSHKEINTEKKKIELVQMKSEKLKPKESEEQIVVQDQKKPIKDFKSKTKVLTIEKKNAIAVSENPQTIPENIFKEKIMDTIQVQIVENVLNTKNNALPIASKVIDDKIAGVAKEIKELEKNNGVVTEGELDALLRKAQKEITTQHILKSNTVNASALLLDVELELDESFKDRVFEALKTGFERLKTTVAERDN